MANDSYYGPYAEFRKRDNYADAFGSALDDLAVKLDLSHVKSCVAFGTGSGEQEMKFVGRLMPGLKWFTAVEDDRESTKALRENFRNGLLPGAETSVVETSLESWPGVDGHVDAALLLNMLSQVHADHRTALFQRLMTLYLSDGGVVVIGENVTSVPSGYVLLMQRLGTPRVDYDVLEKEMLAAGFRVHLKQDFEVQRDLSDPSDDIVRYVQLETGHKHSDSHVRSTIDEIYRQPNMKISPNRLAIFTTR